MSGVCRGVRGGDGYVKSEGVREGRWVCEEGVREGDGCVRGGEGGSEFEERG